MRKQGRQKNARTQPNPGMYRERWYRRKSEGMVHRYSNARGGKGRVWWGREVGVAYRW